MEAGSLTTLVDVVLQRAWRRGSRWHGELHWRCVTATGLELASGSPGVDRFLVFCFGLLHDTRRENEAVDPGHGRRAARLARELRTEGFLVVDPPRFDLLRDALVRHSDGQVSSEPTVGTCWDADRLHLPRVSIEPNPAFFSTRAAHDAGRLADATSLREQGPPAWDDLVRRVRPPDGA